MVADLALVLVVVSLCFNGSCAADLRFDECYVLQSNRCCAAVYPLPVP
jgi:hypothetical protein